MATIKAALQKELPKVIHLPGHKKYHVTGLENTFTNDQTITVTAKQQSTSQISKQEVFTHGKMLCSYIHVIF